MNCPHVAIRRALEQDIERIVKIERLSFRYPYPMELLKSYIARSNACFLVAEVDGEIVGYAIAEHERNTLGHLISIAVSPQWRGKGIGKALLRAVLRKLKERGVQKVYLEVRKNNLIAQHLYESVGFKCTGEIPNYYPDGEDAVIMVLHLDPS